MVIIKNAGGRMVNYAVMGMCKRPCLIVKTKHEDNEEFDV